MRRTLPYVIQNFTSQIINILKKRRTGIILHIRRDFENICLVYFQELVLCFTFVQLKVSVCKYELRVD